MQEKPENLFGKIRLDNRESVGEYFSELMDMGRTQFPRRGRH